MEFGLSKVGRKAVRLAIFQNNALQARDVER